MPKTSRRRAPAARLFQFCTQLHLNELTGLRAATLPQLLRLMRGLPDSAMYFHTHHFVQHYHLVTPEPPNDFAHWVRQALGEERLAELLASVDTVQFATIHALREELTRVLEAYLHEHVWARLRFARPDEEFHALKTVNFVMPTPYTAQTLQEFRAALSHVTIQSIYFHVFEARLRLGRETNDFSAWFHLLHEEDLARQFARFDPYSVTLEDLRAQMLALLDARLETSTAA